MNTRLPLAVSPLRRASARRVLAAAVLSVFVAIWPALIGSSALVAAAYGSGGPGSWLSLARSFTSIMPLQPLTGLVNGPSSISAGSDGRLTILLLGSDTRGGGIARTDTIMIVSVKNGVVSVASIPRDTARIPNPDGGTFSARINAILKKLKVGRTMNQAMFKFEVVIEQLLQIEIDYYALVKFNGFNDLVQAIEPITVNIKSQVRDTRYWDDKSQPSGVYFPADSSYQLYAWQPGGGSPLCNGLWRFQSSPIPPAYWCRRAMPYVRSRKGSSDFVRARRQQDFVIAAARRVINRGAGGNLSDLASRIGYQRNIGQFYTDISPTLDNALDLYNIIDGASVGFQVVFSPPNYATHIPGTTAYQLNLPAVRKVAQQWFGGSGENPPPPTSSPPSTSTPTPTSNPTATPTWGPTATPSPTKSPTAQPSGLPTPIPTAVPTAVPTGQPTAKPSTTPTAHPTSGPTASPTPVPTAGPSGAPSSSPGETVTPGPSGGQTPSPLPSVSAVPSQVISPSPTGAVSSATPGTTGSLPPRVTPSPLPSATPDPGTSTGGQDVAAAVLAGAVIVGGAAVLVVGWMQLGWFKPR